jgi:hypothetical protein
MEISNQAQQRIKRCTLSITLKYIEVHWVKNKITTVIVLSLVTFCSRYSHANDKVDMVIQYLPNKSFITKNTTISQMDAKLANPFVAPPEFRSNYPMKVDDSDETTVEIKTGPLSEDGSYPASFEVVSSIRKTTINGQPVDVQSNALLGVKAIGKIDSNGKILIVKLEGKTVTDEFRTFALKIFSNIGESFTRKNTKPVAVGESFSDKSPFSLPIPGIATIRMDMTAVYTLKNIHNGIANFDGLFSYTLAQSPGDDYVISFDGTGDCNGKISYDIFNKIQLLHRSDCTMKLSIPFEGNGINMTFHTSGNLTTQIK